jgi:hypothetical protein
MCEYQYPFCSLRKIRACWKQNKQRKEVTVNATKHLVLAHKEAHRASSPGIWFFGTRLLESYQP